MVVFIVRTKPYMKTVTNLLIANMSVADLLMTCVFAMPYSVLYLYVQSRWFGGTLGRLSTCKNCFKFFVAMSIAAFNTHVSCGFFRSILRYNVPVKSAAPLIPRMLATNALIWSLACLFVASHFLQLQSNEVCGWLLPLLRWLEAACQHEELKSILHSSFSCFSLPYPSNVHSLFSTRSSAANYGCGKYPENPSINNRRKRKTSIKRRTVKMLIIIVVIFCVVLGACTRDALPNTLSIRDI